MEKQQTNINDQIEDLNILVSSWTLAISQTNPTMLKTVLDRMKQLGIEVKPTQEKIEGKFCRFVEFTSPGRDGQTLRTMHPHDWLPCAYSQWQRDLFALNYF